MGFRHPRQGRVTVDGVDLRDVELASTGASSASSCRTTSSSTGRSARTCLRARRRRERGGRASAAAARCDEFPGPLRARPRHGDRRARREALRRPAPARDDRARDCSRTRASSSSTRRRRASTPRASRSIQESLDASMAGRTTFVIAHRLSTIRTARPDPGARERAHRRARHPRGAPRRGGRYRELYDRQYDLQSRS